MITAETKALKGQDQNKKNKNMETGDNRFQF